MEKDLSNYRESYDKGELLIENVSENPMLLFKDWFNEVDTHFDVKETNAMTISTIGLDGYPKSRVVLLKKYTDDGFIFYTNYNSEKGKAIIANPNCCLSFFWPAAERQVIIKGKVEKVAASISDQYFESRPRGSRLGALASPQSEVVKNRAVLEENLENLENQYEGQVIPRPENWGGFVLKPVELEFWQGRPNRLHDRIRYKLDENQNWNIDRLAP